MRVVIERNASWVTGMLLFPALVITVFLGILIGFIFWGPEGAEQDRVTFWPAFGAVIVTLILLMSYLIWSVPQMPWERVVTITKESVEESQGPFFRRTWPGNQAQKVFIATAGSQVGIIGTIYIEFADSEQRHWTLNVCRPNGLVADNHHVTAKQLQEPARLIANQLGIKTISETNIHALEMM